MSSDEIEMPCECSECGGTWDLNSLYRDPRHPHSYDVLICPPCKREIESAGRAS